MPRRQLLLLRLPASPSARWQGGVCCWRLRPCLCGGKVVRSFPCAPCFVIKFRLHSLYL